MTASFAPPMSAATRFRPETLDGAEQRAQMVMRHGGFGFGDGDSDGGGGGGGGCSFYIEMFGYDYGYGSAMYSRYAAVLIHFC
uniref:Uncharacterized protein n=1 Tax=Glossina morsitans morsitans TaxID=37546 RepID=A0A1B0FG76_GLOMM